MLSRGGERVFTKKSDALKVKFLAQAVSLQESQKKNETTLPLSTCALLASLFFGFVSLLRTGLRSWAW